MKNKAKTVNIIQRPKRSFRPQNYKAASILHFKGEGAQYIGREEPTWPDADIQKSWTRHEYERQVMAAFNWYTHTQEDKAGRAFAINALSLSGHFPELIKMIASSNRQLSHTSAWLLRMMHVGLCVSFKEKRFIVRELREIIAHQKQTKPTEISNKPSIQDHVAAKLQRIQGEIDLLVDEFIQSGYKSTSRTLMNVLASPETAPPGNRTRDLANYIGKYLAEYKLAVSGKNQLVSEAYSSVSKRQLNAIIAWCEQAITDVNNFGQLKQSARKTRKKKAVSPNKLVSKLKFLKTFPELKLASVDPVQIIKSSEIWVYNTKLRKLGKYCALGGGTLDVKGTKILNIDTIKSVQKTLRKPAIQLKEFGNYSKPGSSKWFQQIHAVATPLREALNADSVIIKAFK